MHKYQLEFILNVGQDTSAQVLKNSLLEFGEDLEIADLAPSQDARMRNFHVYISTEDPTVVFDACAQFGRIKSVKIDERHK